jgi:hypothetical protein
MVKAAVKQAVKDCVLPTCVVAESESSTLWHMDRFFSRYERVDMDRPFCEMWDITIGTVYLINKWVSEAKVSKYLDMLREKLYAEYDEAWDKIVMKPDAGDVGSGTLE